MPGYEVDGSDTLVVLDLKRLLEPNRLAGTG